MGTWGPGLFSDDLALDVKGDYRELIQDGVDDDDATNSMLDRYADSIADADQGPVFWLALAVSQSQIGRLDPVVKQRALDVIASGADLARWAEGDHTVARNRRQVLDRVRRRLDGPQPARKPLRKPRPYVTDLQPGDVLACRTRRGNFVIVRVVRLAHNKGSSYPIVRWLLWGNSELPAGDLEALPDSREGGLRHVQPNGRLDYGETGFTKIGTVEKRPGDDSNPIHDYGTWAHLAD